MRTCSQKTMTSRVEKIVEGNPPRAFRSPQSGAEADEPRTVVGRFRGAFLHANRLTVLPLRRQFMPLKRGNPSGGGKVNLGVLLCFTG